jgi:cardiolipin-specific phospholipase
MAGLVRRWWTASDHNLLLESERRLLSELVRHPFLKPSARRHEDDRGGGLNLVEFRAPPGRGAPSLPTVVMAHGFGSGLSFFYRNVDHLLDSGKVGRVILVDWLGMGGSARPPCWESPVRSLFSNRAGSPRSYSFCNSEFSPSSAIDFFLDPFDRMLRDGGLFESGEPLWLVGHSLGGYLVGRYAMRIHDRGESMTTASTSTSASPTTAPNVTKLVLASPVGFRPLPPPPRSRIASSPDRPTALRLVDALWSANLTPQAVVRLMGPARGRGAVRRALGGRIPHLGESELDLLAEYLYHVTVAPPSGEYAMNSLMEPGASEEDGSVGVYALEPLGGGSMAGSISSHRGRSPSSPPPPPSPPSTLESIKVLFGDGDWMAFHEPEARREMGRIRSECGWVRSAVHVVPGAGHHLYLDNPETFGRHIVED